MTVHLGVTIGGRLRVVGTISSSSHTRCFLLSKMSNQILRDNGATNLSFFISSFILPNVSLDEQVTKGCILGVAFFVFNSLFAQPQTSMHETMRTDW